MTVSSTSSRVVCVGDGTATIFPFHFKVNGPADLVVVYTDTTGTDFTLSPAQYTATGFGLDAGGSVTYPLSGPPIADNTKLTIYRDVAITQPTSISNQGAMWPQVIEAALDRLTCIAQRVSDSVSRSLVISPTDDVSLRALPNATTRANSVLAFNADGQPYAATLTGSLVAVANWLVNFLSSATSAPAACDALGAAQLAANNEFDGDNVFKGDNNFTDGRLTLPTRAAGDNGADGASTGFVATAIANARTASIGGIVMWSYLGGLGLANNLTAPNTRIDIAAGVCADRGNGRMLSLATAGTLDCATNGANGLDTGNLANNTWYHVFAIGMANGTTALLASTSVHEPNLPADYMFFRRIGAFKTDASAHIIPFIQEGDRFYWKTPRLDMVVGNPGTAPFLQAFASVPTGLPVHIVFNIVYIITSAGWPAGLLYISDPATADMAPSPNGAPLTTTSSVNSAGGNGAPTKLTMRTNSTAQLRFRAATSNGSDAIYVVTLGWIDRRGCDL
jgi:hypothetical protein